MARTTDNIGLLVVSEPILPAFPEGVRRAELTIRGSAYTLSAANKFASEALLKAALDDGGVGIVSYSLEYVQSDHAYTAKGTIFKPLPDEELQTPGDG